MELKQRTASTPTTTSTPTTMAATTTSTAATTNSTSWAPSSSGSPLFADCEMFPSNAIFNTRIDDTSKFPAHANSWSWINLVGANVPFLANWGLTDNPADSGYYGIPVNVVDGTSATTDWPVLAYNFALSGVNTLLGYPDKSDCAVPNGWGFGIQNNCSGTQPSQVHFPMPKSNVLSEHGTTCNDASYCGDHHVLVVEKGACRLWESYYAYNIWGTWYAMATAAWDLKSNALRPDGWGSADAAGLPITPLLAKASEANSGEIKHALRVTFRDSAIALNWQWPARYSAGDYTPGGIPMGSLLRLKADFVIPDYWSPQAKAVATAAKRYGLYVADNGMDFYVQGAPSSGWGDQTYNQLRSISLANMEFVDTKAITSDPRFNVNSMQASW